MKRGDIIVARLPQTDGTPGKVRPALVIQCDRLNAKLQSTIVAAITSNTKLAGKEPSQLFFDPAVPEGASSGLSYPSVVKCENLFTVHQASVVDTLGRLSEGLTAKLAECLRNSLELQD